MSTRSKFERRLGLRDIGFSIKIPDVGRSLKPFDYVVGVPIQGGKRKILRFVAIEAKAAIGWTLRGDALLDHQIRALDLVESLAKYSSWLAIGFLDMPRMKRDWLRRNIEKPMRPEAYLLWWEDAKYIQRGSGVIRYGDIIKFYPDSKMDYIKIGTTYKWVPHKAGSFFERLAG